MTFEIAKTVEFDAGHRVPNHNSKCRNPHGHRYSVEVSLEGYLVDTSGASDEGMVADFGDLKRIMMDKIHDPLDHGFIVHVDDSDLLTRFGYYRDRGARVVAWHRHHDAPDWKVIIFPYIPTAENLAKWCFEQLRTPINDAFGRYDLRIKNVSVWETPTSVAVFTYEDGLA